MKRTLEDKINWAIAYLDSPNLSMSDIALRFGVSKRTIQNAMNELKILGEKYSLEHDEKYLKIYELSQLVQAKKTHNLIVGAKKGGRNGKPTPNLKHGGRNLTISCEMIEEIASLRREFKLSYRDIEQLTGVPKSTIHDNKKRIEVVQEKNNKGKR